MRQLLFFIQLLCVPAAVTAQQDTLRHEHQVRLPVSEKQAGYEDHIAQQPYEVSSFEFYVPDSCRVFIVVRSENDSLDVRIGGKTIQKKAKQERKYVYSFTGQLPKGINELEIRTRKYCRYTIYLKGQL